MEIPVADESHCTHCGACAELCQFKAIAVMGDVLLTFPEMCHGCGGCLAVCPEEALSPGKRELGEISWGRAGLVAGAQANWGHADGHPESTAGITGP